MVIGDGTHGQGGRLVRQRVGLLEPLRRAGRQGPASRAPRRRPMSFAKASVRDAEVDGPPGAGPGRLQRPARRTARSPTTRGSGRRCRRSSCCASAAPRVVLVSHLGRPEGQADPALSMAPVGERLGELLGAEVDAGAGGGRRRGRGDGRRARPRRRAAAREQSASSRARPRTTRSWPKRSPRWPTSTSTTPSAPPTAPTPRPRASPTSCPATPACCSSAR